MWLDGSVVLADGRRRDVDLAIQMPTKVALGVTHHVTAKLSLLVAGSWIDSSRFGDSDIQFEDMSAFNIPFIPAAKDEWRAALALEYELAQSWKFRFGLSRATPIVGTEGVSPLLFDNEDRRVSLGVGTQRGQWSLDAAFGFAFYDSRDVSSEQALVIPGRYRSGGGIFSVGMIHRM